MVSLLVCRFCYIFTVLSFCVFGDTLTSIDHKNAGIRAIDMFSGVGGAVAGAHDRQALTLSPALTCGDLPEKTIIRTSLRPSFITAASKSLILTLLQMKQARSI